MRMDFGEALFFQKYDRGGKRQDILNLVAARVRPVYDRSKKTDERVGIAEEKPMGLYPAVPNLAAMERKLGLPHRPLDKKGGDTLL